jgi:hypothetical protein
VLDGLAKAFVQANPRSPAKHHFGLADIQAGSSQIAESRRGEPGFVGRADRRRDRGV